ncbi:MAG: chemotaxis response regulator protein-glutamate methylesterase [Desulfohalobiaceae bacterium]
MVTVLVVDDSAFMRKAVSTMLEKDPDIQVAGSARNGEECLQKIRELEPQVVTLDIEMPVMDGLTALRHIMMESPRPVLMVSSLTTEGAEATMKAMELGAMDFIPKKLSKVSLDIVKIEDELRSKVKALAKSKPRFAPARKKPKETWAPETKELIQGSLQREVVGIGVSTGGPPAVQQIVSSLGRDFPGSILIAQHMPGTFTKAFAKRLDQSSSLQVKQAENKDKLEKGLIFVAPGGMHLKLEGRSGRMYLEVSTDPPGYLYKPSASVLLNSLAERVGARGLGVILTGMGNDGLEGVRRLKARDGRVLAQSEASCVVYGMPRAVIEQGLADQILDIQDMAEGILAGMYK